MRTETYHFLKAREGGQSRGGVLALLRLKKIECRPAYSHPGGYTAVEVTGGRRARREAEKIVCG